MSQSERNQKRSAAIAEEYLRQAALARTLKLKPLVVAVANAFRAIYTGPRVRST